ncbi:hypothetical protein TWF506_011088 [Arthrobotrys conoides]|uniref:Uncharacterized protein n=1 Tax=Arthrobotrys conoides TaxID=74498 RepID=A0AAN8NQ01_9PEZI
MAEPALALYKYVTMQHDYVEYTILKSRNIEYIALDTFDGPTPENFETTPLHELDNVELKFLRDVIATINKNEERLQGTGYSYYLYSLNIWRSTLTASRKYKLYLKLGKPVVPSVGKPSGSRYSAGSVNDPWDTSTGMHTPASTIL